MDSYTSHDPRYCSTGQAYEAWRRINGDAFTCCSCSQEIPRQDWSRANLEMSISDDRSSVMSMRAWHRAPVCQRPSWYGVPEGGSYWMWWRIEDARRSSGMTV